jgi:hypothetical protein
MDPFAEKDMIECLTSIASSMRNMDRKMDELIMAVREVGLGLEDSEGEVDDIVNSEETIS